MYEEIVFSIMHAFIGRSLSQVEIASEIAKTCKFIIINQLDASISHMEFGKL